jgi:drug/metabolite transporter (DMT)-like permease
LSASYAVASALIAALLFGASTPFAKLLAGDVPPVMLAGLLYFGSGAGLWSLRVLREHRISMPRLQPSERLWLMASIVSGGIVAPILLMCGLADESASSASLLLNLEGVFTALIAWLFYRENAGRQVVLGMALIVAGGVVLAWPREVGHGSIRGTLLIAAACLAWGLDNNLTRKVSAADADFIAGTKGLAAGTTNLALGLALGASLPSAAIAASAMAVGLIGYGISLVLFVLALRGLGSARAGAYFSTAPFLGAGIAIFAFHSPLPAGFWASALLMAAGVFLHLTERHSHRHSHEAMLHTHAHRHDAHHRHGHEFPWNGVEPHTHEHRHDGLTHDHAHYPDVHHRHRH